MLKDSSQRVSLGTDGYTFKPIHVSWMHRSVAVFHLAPSECVLYSIEQVMNLALKMLQKKMGPPSLWNNSRDTWHSCKVQKRTPTSSDLIPVQAWTLILSYYTALANQIQLHRQPLDRSPPYVHSVQSIAMRELDAAMESPRFGMEVSSNGLGSWLLVGVLPKNGGDSIYLYIHVCMLCILFFSKMSS
jgi:hypothetical protein